MAAMDRATMLRKFVEQSPQDPFPRYGLAMALRSAGDKDAARGEFDLLLRDHADYVPTYLMAAQNLLDLGARETAREVLQRGIDKAAACGNSHAKGELEGALAALEP
jgi:tetratricopeptide (TPR) repeat protein